MDDMDFGVDSNEDGRRILRDLGQPHSARSTTKYREDCPFRSGRGDCLLLDQYEHCFECLEHSIKNAPRHLVRLNGFVPELSSSS